MNKAQLLKVLIGVRERRSSALDAAVRAALQQEQQHAAEVQAAEHTLVGALAAEAQERHKLLSLTDVGQTFDIHLLTLREHVVSSKKELVVQRQAQVEERHTALSHSRQALRTQREQRTRNEKKIESLQSDLKTWRDERQREEDDQQDEESEETAIARLCRAAPDGVSHASTPGAAA